MLYDNYELKIDLTKEKIDKVNDSLNKTVNKILDKEYTKYDEEKCEKCAYYNILCKHN